MTQYELTQLAHNIEGSISKSGSFTEDAVIKYVNDNFFTFSESDKTEIINATLEEFFALPFY